MPFFPQFARKRLGKGVNLCEAILQALSRTKRGVRACVMPIAAVRLRRMPELKKLPFARQFLDRGRGLPARATRTRRAVSPYGVPVTSLSDHGILSRLCVRKFVNTLFHIFSVPLLPLESFLTEVRCSSPANSRTRFFRCANHVRKLSASSSIKQVITQPFASIPFDE